MVQQKYFDDMSRKEQQVLLKEYCTNSSVVFRIFKKNKKFFVWLIDSKGIYKNKQDEFYQRADCKEFHEQYKTLSACVKKAIGSWLSMDLLSEYSEEAFETVCLCVSNDISGSIIVNKEISPKMIANSISDNFFDEFDDERFLSEFCLKPATDIFANIIGQLPRDSWFVLPEHLWSYWDDYFKEYNEKNHKK